MGRADSALSAFLISQSLSPPFFIALTPPPPHPVGPVCLSARERRRDECGEAEGPAQAGSSHSRDSLCEENKSKESICAVDKKKVEFLLLYLFSLNRLFITATKGICAVCILLRDHTDSRDYLRFLRVCAAQTKQVSMVGFFKQPVNCHL